VDAITLLTKDHRTVDELFDRFERSSDPSERGELVAKMIEELSVHAAIEEQELYPLMRRAFAEDDLVDEAEHEHAEAKAVLAVLVQLRIDDQHFEPLVGELIADVRHHVEEEENELFPKLREAVSEDELDEVGQRLERAKQSAPTKPSADELKQLSRDELYEFAKKIGLEGRSDMTKDDLAAALAPF
jgi:hemerythrin superfamily protein